MFSPVSQTPSGGNVNFTSPLKQSPVIDTTKAQQAYQLATEHPNECHFEMGILRPEGNTLETRLGKNEEYGAHRVGSVTKTFTTFLALKLINDKISLGKGKLLSLDTKCGEVIAPEILQSIFAEPIKAAEMTLDQLLSHTAGLELDDHNHEGTDPDLRTMQDRFIYEGKKGHKYQHTSQPGDGIGSYSNAGYAVAAWMLEVAYNKNRESAIPFSQIMKDEIFSKVFKLTEDSRYSPGPSGDIIGSGAGDMTSSVKDLLQVAKCLQQEKAHLALHFGPNWQKTMLEPRDLFAHQGIGCVANKPSIQHFGLNCELINGKKYDVTAVVILPLGENQPGLVALCDSNALGTLPKQQEFANEIMQLAGITNEEPTKQSKYDTNFFCPNAISTQVFKGDAYVVTDKDPFGEPPSETITCSRNGMKHELIRESSFDFKDAIGYRDENGNRWMMISKDEGKRKMIYSRFCLVSPSPEIRNLTQPSLENLKAIEGTYYDSVDDVTYEFTEREGHLYFQEGQSDKYPALYLPQEDFWVVSLPEGRKNVKFRFPDNPKSEPLIIVDISKEIQDSSTPISVLEKQPPYKSYQK